MIEQLKNLEWNSATQAILDITQLPQYTLKINSCSNGGK